MSCQEFLPLIELVPLLGAEDADAEPLLEPAQAELLFAHLDACAACRALAADHAGAFEAWTRATESGLRPLSPGLRERVLAAAAPSDRKPALVSPAPDPARVDALRARVALSCSFCHGRIERREVVFCAECMAPHHQDCFTAHGRCSLPGCEATRLVRPQEAAEVSPRPPRRRRGLRVVLALVAAGGVGVGAAALGLRGPVAHVAGPGEEATVLVDARGEPLGRLLYTLGREAEGSVLVEPALADVPVTLEASGPWRDVVRSVALRVGARVEELPGGALHLTRPLPVALHRGRIEVREVIRLLAERAGRNVLLDPRVAGEVMADVEEQDWHDALTTVANAAGVHVTWAGESVLVTAEPLSAAALAALEPGPPGPEVSIQALRRPLPEVIDQLAREHGARVEVDRELEDALVTLVVTRLPLRRALEAVARVVEGRVEEREGGLLALARPRPIAIRARACPVERWFQFLGTMARRDVVMGIEAGQVDVDLTGIDPLRAIRLSALVFGFDLSEEGGVLTLRRDARWPWPVRLAPEPLDLPVEVMPLLEPDELRERVAALLLIQTPPGGEAATPELLEQLLRIERTLFELRRRGQAELADASESALSQLAPHLGVARYRVSEAEARRHLGRLEQALGARDRRTARWARERVRSWVATFHLRGGDWVALATELAERSDALESSAGLLLDVELQATAASIASRRQDEWALLNGGALSERNTGSLRAGSPAVPGSAGQPDPEATLEEVEDGAVLLRWRDRDVRLRLGE